MNGEQKAMGASGVRYSVCSGHILKISQTGLGAPQAALAKRWVADRVACYHAITLICGCQRHRFLAGSGILTMSGTSRTTVDRLFRLAGFVGPGEAHPQASVNAPSACLRTRPG